MALGKIPVFGEIRFREIEVLIGQCTQEGRHRSTSGRQLLPGLVLELVISCACILSRSTKMHALVRLEILKSLRLLLGHPITEPCREILHQDRFGLLHSSPRDLNLT